jgi:hypothetical protein
MTKKIKKVKSTGKIGDDHESQLPWEYQCNVCGKKVIHTNRSNHIQDSKHSEFIYPKVFKAVK